jgi:hypothetical protein
MKLGIIDSMLPTTVTNKMGGYKQCMLCIRGNYDMGDNRVNYVYCIRENYEMDDDRAKDVY